MYSSSTVLGLYATVLLAGLTSVQPASGQTTAPQPIVDWRQTGNTVTADGLAGFASGPVIRVWYTGSRVLAQTRSGLYFETSDFEHWRKSSAPVPPVAQSAPAGTMPESGARVVAAGGGRLYAFGVFVYRSDDGGKTWENLTEFHGASIVGTGLHDLSVSPGDSEELIVAGDSGLFRSIDGGKSWSGINDGLPNFSITRLLDLPVADQGLRVALWSPNPVSDHAVAWPPGNKLAWLPASNSDLETESQLRMALSIQLGAPVTAVAIAGDSIYVGFQTGEIRVSADRGFTWRISEFNSRAVERFWIDPQDSRVALAALGSAPENPFRIDRSEHVLHTANGGAFWDDFTANLPDGAAHGITADHASGAIYAATDRGVFWSYADLDGLGTIQPWTPLAGLPDAVVIDVKLDAQGNQLWVAVDGYGVYSTLAPHRSRDPKVVSAADFIARTLAPGSLVTILGAKVETVSANGLPAAVLAATATESQVQIPFDARGNSLSLDAAGLKLPLLPLADAVPVIFVSRDGSPMLLDAEKGVLLDAMTPARSGTRVQILAAGLGRVVPGWPTGVPAPTENPPHAAGAVHAFLDRMPVEVTRAELAPGYIGFYLVEINIPRISNYGPAELYLDVDGAPSNRVRVYIEP